VKRLTLFVSSPGDVQPERERVERVVGILNGDFVGLVKIDVVRWETRYYAAHASFQPQIVRPSDCDVVVGIVRARLGTPLPDDAPRRADGSGYASGTAYEIESALSAHTERGAPSLFMFRAAGAQSVSSDALDEGQRQLAALEQFWQTWFVSADGRCLRAFQIYRDLIDFSAQLEGALRQWLTDAGHLRGQPLWNLDKLGSPYRGLEAFDESHQRVFFGRRSARDVGWQRLLDARERGQPFALLLGGSGVGKSSLMRSGLVPRFRATLDARGIERARVALMKPGIDPLAALDAALAPHSEPGAGSRVERLLARFDRADRSQAIDPNAPRIEERTELMLGIDQFEELLTHEPATIDAFAHALDALLESQRVWIVATHRTDRYAELLEQPTLAKLKQRAVTLDLSPPTPSELDEIIRGPARAAGLSFEVDNGVDLADALRLDAGGSDALALLQLTLKQLFEQREGHELKWAAYRQMGGVQGAVVAAAERAFAALDAPAQAALPALLAALTAGFADGGEALAQPLSLDDANATPERRALIEALASERLLIREDGRIRVAHEALLRQWPRAVSLLDGIRDTIELRERLARPTQDWLRHGREVLAPGALLASAAAVRNGAHAALLGDSYTRFIDASLAAEKTVRQRRTRRLTMIASVMGALALGAIGAALYAFQQRERAQASFAASVRAVDGLSRDIGRSLKAARGISAATVESVLTQARTLIDGIAATDPNNAELNRARTGMLLGFSETYRSVGRGREADRALNEALALLLTLNASPSARALDLTRLNVEAELAQSQRAFFALDSGAAQTHAEAALLLAAALPDATELEMDARRRIGSSRYAAGDLPAALNVVRAQPLVRPPNPSASWLAHHAALDVLEGTVRLGMSQLDEAKAAFERARVDAEAALDLEPTLTLAAEVALRARRGFARRLELDGQRDAARAEINTALDFGRELVAANPNALLLTLSLQDLLDVGAEQREAERDRAGQRALLEEAVTRLGVLAERDPDNLYLRAEYGYALRRQGELLITLAALDAADVALTDALGLDRAVLAATPNRPASQRYLAATLEQMGRLNTKRKRFDEAETALDESLALRVGLSRTFPNEPEWRRLIALSQTQRMLAAFHAGNINAALKRQTKAESIYRALHAELGDAESLDRLIDAKFTSVSLLAELYRYADARRALDGVAESLRSPLLGKRERERNQQAIAQVHQLIDKAERTGQRPASGR
jgi:eukaryotic-like serine/threonine-protein kinase